MKKCQICGKPASMFLTQIVDGKVTELAFCEACAKAKGLFDPQSLTFAEKFFPEQFKEKLDNLMRELARPAQQERTPSQPVAANVLTECPACHFRLEDLRRTDKLGCPYCYTVFAQELIGEPSGNNAEADNQPTQAGSTPQTPSLGQLRAELQQAIAREDYETAARLRDQIKELS